MAASKPPIRVRVRLASERVQREYSPLVNVALIGIGWISHNVVCEVARCLKRDSASFIAALAVGVGGALFLVYDGS